MMTDKTINISLVSKSGQNSSKSKKPSINIQSDIQIMYDIPDKSNIPPPKKYSNFGNNHILFTNENQNENKLNIKLDIKSQRSQIKKGDSSISKINNTSANFDILNTGTYINH